MERELMAAYGPWVAGWSWATSEPGGGGPVHAWCCAEHSLLRDGEPRSASVERVVEAVREWHEWLVALAATLATLKAATAALPVEEAVEVAANRLLVDVLERTGAEDAWYHTLELVLGWFLTSTGHDADTVVPLVEATCSGRFESWVAPAPGVASAALADLALDVALTDPVEPDHTDQWRRKRGKSFGPIGVAVPPFAAADGQLAYVHRVDAARSPERARRMELALREARSGGPLTSARLQALASLALGAPAQLRTTVAGRGHARYGLLGDDELERWLRDAAGDEQAVVRAARVYLDVCFGHPFVDGNGRAARLALAHVLAGEGLRLHVAAPVVAMARSPRGAGWNLAWVLGRLVGRVSPTS